MRREIPLLICFVMGVVMLVQYYIPHEASMQLYQKALQWFIIILTFAMLLGIGSLIRMHASKIRFKRRDWIFSVVALSGLAMSVVTGGFGILGSYTISPDFVPGDGFIDRIYVTLMATGIDQGSAFMWLYNYIQIPMQATMFSLLAFFIASASFRTFKARTFEASLLLVAAIVVMLGRVPFDNMMLGIISGVFGSTDGSIFIKVLAFPFEKLAAFAEWILDYPNMAAKRGIIIGIGLGVMSTCLKIILGIERSWLGGGD